MIDGQKVRSVTFPVWTCWQTFHLGCQVTTKCKVYIYICCISYFPCCDWTCFSFPLFAFLILIYCTVLLLKPCCIWWDHTNPNRTHLTEKSAASQWHFSSARLFTNPQTLCQDENITVFVSRQKVLMNLGTVFVYVTSVGCVIPPSRGQKHDSYYTNSLWFTRHKQSSAVKRLRSGVVIKSCAILRFAKMCLIRA